MTMYGLVQNGTLVSIKEFDSSPPYIAPNKGTWLPLVDCPTDEDVNLNVEFWDITGPTIVITDTQITRTWAAEYKDLSVVKQDLITQVAVYRQQYMSGGIIWNNYPVDTTPEIVLLLIGAAVGAILAIQNGQDYNIPWKLSDGTFITLNATSLFAMFVAVSLFIAGCYNNEGLLDGQINALADVPSCMTFDNTQGWPANTVTDAAAPLVTHIDANGNSISS